MIPVTINLAYSVAVRVLTDASWKNSYEYRGHCFDTRSPGFCLHPTGGGKSLVFNAVTSVLHGVTLCICPLLSLGADQTKKIFSKTFSDCT